MSMGFIRGFKTTPPAAPKTGTAVKNASQITFVQKAIATAFY